MFGISIKEKIDNLNKTIKLPENERSFYRALNYYQSEINKILGGKGLLSSFNTACMEYHMISEPRRVLYGNGIPHDLSQADEWEKDLYIGLRTFLEKYFPQYTDNENITKKEFDEFSYGLRAEEDRITNNDINQLNIKIQEMRKEPKNWTC